MAIFNEWQYINRYDAGQEAVNRGDWRTAYDCFMDCKGYIEHDRAWDDDEISKLDKLIELCHAHF